MGWNGKVFYCWRCGSLPRFETLRKITGKSFHEIRTVMDGLQPTYTLIKSKKRTVNTSLRMPYGAGELGESHRRYLIERRFDPDKLMMTWGLLGTGQASDLPHHIIIPIEQGGKRVAWQARALRDSKAKYLSCPDEDAIIPVKECLYGLDKVKGDIVVVTEGPTKVWRLGPGAVATFGASVTTAQVNLLKQFKQVVVLFDDDPAGQDGARKLAASLAVFGGSVTIVNLKGVKDGADVKQRDATWIMERLLGK